MVYNGEWSIGFQDEVKQSKIGSFVFLFMWLTFKQTVGLINHVDLNNSKVNWFI